MNCVTKRKPTTDEERDLIFAMTVAKHVKSNAIVYAKNLQQWGLVLGRCHAADSSRIAARKADDLAENNGLDQSPLLDLWRLMHSSLLQMA